MPRLDFRNESKMTEYFCQPLRIGKKDKQNGSKKENRDKRCERERRKERKKEKTGMTGCSTRKAKQSISWSKADSRYALLLIYCFRAHGLFPEKGNQLGQIWGCFSYVPLHQAEGNRMHFLPVCVSRVYTFFSLWAWNELGSGLAIRCALHAMSIFVFFSTVYTRPF